MLIPTGVDRELRGDKKGCGSSEDMSRTVPALRAPAGSHISREFALSELGISSSFIPQISF